MNDPNDPQSAPVPPPAQAETPPPLVIPVRYGYAPMPARSPAAGVVPAILGSLLRSFLFLLLAASVGLNVVLLLLGGSGLGGLGEGSSYVPEKLVSGPSKAKDKIAIVKLDGIIMEGTTDFTQKSIDRAAADEHVKAVVLRINSPGGTITASDDLHRRIAELAQGKHAKQKGGKKPVVASMGALAASGGYYVAMPAEFVMAEQTTITGSIGVYAAFPNIAGLADKYGFGMNVIKAGDIKDSGSMFHKMTPQERQLWQDMVDSAYDRFLTVVADGRSKKLTKKDLTEVIEGTEKEIPDRDADGTVIKIDGVPKMVKYWRKRADGGIFTAKEAETYGLIDGTGYREDAVTKAASLAGLGEYKVVSYDRPPTLSSMLFGAEAEGSRPIDPAKLAQGACPRLWFLAPQAELSGIFAAMGQK